MRACCLYGFSLEALGGAGVTLGPAFVLALYAEYVSTFAGGSFYSLVNIGMQVKVKFIL